MKARQLCVMPAARWPGSTTSKTASTQRAEAVLCPCTVSDTYCWCKKINLVSVSVFLIMKRKMVF